MTIEEALDRFLEYQGTRIPGMVHIEYEKLANMLRVRLNKHGHMNLSNGERAYLFSRPGKTFCRVFGPEKILPEARKLLASMHAGEMEASWENINHLSGMTRRLAIWLRKQNV
jgi:hypothetical protein